MGGDIFTILDNLFLDRWSVAFTAHSFFDRFQKIWGYRGPNVPPGYAYALWCVFEKYTLRQPPLRGWKVCDKNDL